MRGSLPRAQVAFELDASPAAQAADNGSTSGAVAVAADTASGVAAMDEAQLWDALQRGIRWPTPTESPPFWDRPARDELLLLGDSLPSRLPLLRHLHL